METIIGILGAIAILIFKVIEKKMKDSAQGTGGPVAGPEPMRQYRTLEDVFPEVSHDYVEDTPEPKVIRVEIPKEAPKEIEAAQIKGKEKPLEILKKVEPTAEKKEKIDPKKLIVYSEIMNRKY